MLLWEGLLWAPCLTARPAASGGSAASLCFPTDGRANERGRVRTAMRWDGDGDGDGFGGHGGGSGDGDDDGGRLVFFMSTHTHTCRAHERTHVRAAPKHAPVHSMNTRVCVCLNCTHACAAATHAHTTLWVECTNRCVLLTYSATPFCALSWKTHTCVLMHCTFHIRQSTHRGV